MPGRRRASGEDASECLSARRFFTTTLGRDLARRLGVARSVLNQFPPRDSYQVYRGEIDRQIDILQLIGNLKSKCCRKDLILVLDCRFY